MKLWQLAVVGLVVGFVASVRHRMAEACSCAPSQGWDIELVDAPAGFDRTPWTVAHVSGSNDGSHYITSGTQELTLILDPP